MARVAVALALALLTQGAFAAPSCGCASGLPFPDAYPNSLAGAIASSPFASSPLIAGAASPLAGAYPAFGGAFAGAYPDALAGAYSPLAGAYPDALAGAYSPLAPASTLPAPIGIPQVVGTSAGPATAYTTGPVCNTATFEVPIKSATSAVSGPVSIKSDIVDGYCSTSCAATRSKCGGTTKNVSFKTPSIINKGSRTYSSVSAIGNAVTTRDTQAGKPLVSTQVYPAPSFPASPVYGPGAFGPGAFGPGAFGPAAYGPGAYAPGALAPGAFAPGAYAPGVCSVGAANFLPADLGALLTAGPVGYPGVYPAPSTCGC